MSEKYFFFLVADKPDEICLRKGCLISSSMLIDFINETVNPCEDFYQFACGHFLKEATFPEFASSATAASAIRTKILNQIRNFLEEDNYPDEPRMSKLPKRFYKSCMNTSMIEEENKNTLETMLESFGGWPVLNESNWNEKEFDWQKTILNLKRNGHAYEFILHFMTRVKSSKSKMIIVSN